ncbi:ComF family protein [Actinokineospora auranticolor]|nr:ComF family protein [Actinokineospora auranticolor]
MNPRTALDLLLPRYCAGCAHPATDWCPACGETLAGLHEVHRTATRAGPRVFALAPYAGPVRRAILAYKEKARVRLAVPLGQALARAVPRLAARLLSTRPAATPPAPSTRDPSFAADPSPRAATSPWGAPSPMPVIASGVPDHPDPNPPTPNQALWLIPAPSRDATARRRGGHHMLRVADEVSRALGERGIQARVTPALRLGWRAGDSVGLSPEARAHNLESHLSVDPTLTPPPGAPILVLDDVVTTGSTAAACGRALAGVDRPVLAVLACAATV